ncbi:aldolase [Cystobasidium minutum MCA 4210]|uniref:aldolase n=1 Tax=Cystobasidium minutum MCA 4210 TaxID=1397322 RepID=UPI0034CFA5FB|eukprot:jgi/Rhomi1/190631/estExt_fgenesh1_pg.C_5_t10458
MMNGHSAEVLHGIYVPVLTFFEDTKEQNVDHATLEKHIHMCLAGGSQGIVILGSTGERVCLSEEEQDSVVRTARKALDSFGQPDRVLIAGAGGHSTTDAIKRVNAAAAAGAQYALVLPPSYYPAFYGGDKGLRDFYVDLAAEAKIPIIIYSYPGVCSGIDMSSNLISSIMKAAPNVVGVKHTDHNVGKIARVAAQNPTKTVLAGASDYGIGAWSVGATGAITGAGNVAPKLLQRLFKLQRDGKAQEAQELQGKLAVGEALLGAGGVAAHKYLIEAFYGYGGVPRRPQQPSPDAFKKEALEAWQSLMEIEKSL